MTKDPSAGLDLAAHRRAIADAYLADEGEAIGALIADCDPGAEARARIDTRTAGLVRDITITGAGDHLEVWDSAAWAGFIDTYEDDFSDQEDEVIPGLI